MSTYNETSTGGIKGGSTATITGNYTPIANELYIFHDRHYGDLKPLRGETPTANHPVMNSLVGWWFMNENTGTELFDLSQQSANGAFTGTSGVKWKPGRKGPVLYFDNNFSDYVNVGDQSELDFSTNSFSLSIWYKINASTSEIFIEELSGSLLSKDQISGGGYYLSYIDGVVEFTITDGSNYVSVNYSAIDNVWEHATVVVDRVNQTVNIYKNATLKNTANISDVGSVTNSSPFWIGNGHNYGVLKTYVEDVRVWSRTLTSNEIADFYMDPYDPFKDLVVSAFCPVINGTSDIGKTVYNTASGECLLSGTATVSLVIVASGGTTIGSAATPTVDYNVNASGGVLIGSTVTPTVTYNVNASGGCLINSTASPAATYNTNTSGGILIGSTSDAVLNFNVIAIGGCLIGSTSIPNVTYNITSSGGLLIAGTNAESVDSGYTASGGCLISGNATAFVNYNITPSNGCLVNSTSYPTVTYNVNSVGGTTIAGIGGINIQYNVIPSGGTTINSTVTPQVTYNITSIGGVKFSGHGAVEQTEIANGGVKLGGTSFNIYEEIMQGGVSVSGESNDATFHVFAIVECERNQFKCGGKNQDQYCITFSKIQGFGAAIFKNIKDPTAFCLTKECNASSAYIASITLCRQNSALITTPGETIAVVSEDPLPESVFALALESKKPMATKPQKFKQVTNTPQMLALKNEKVEKTVTEKPKPIQEKRANAPKFEKVNRMRTVTNTPELNAFKKGIKPKTRIDSGIHVL